MHNEGSRSQCVTPHKRRHTRRDAIISQYSLIHNQPVAQLPTPTDKDILPSNHQKHPNLSQGVLFPCTMYRVIFLTGPPHFQYQNEKACSANEELFYIKNFLKKQSWLAATCFHFGTENREEQLKKAPCMFRVFCQSTIKICSQFFFFKHRQHQS